MTSLLVQFMWAEALAKPLDLLIAAVVGAFLWHWFVKGWTAFVRWVWAEVERNGYKRHD